MRKRRAKRRSKLIAMLGGSCQHCGSKKDLEFDHVNRKKKSFEIADAKDGNEELLIQEAKKCILLCRPCHEKKTRDNWEYNESGPAKHGTVWRYKKYKCRCNKCDSAMKASRKEEYARRKKRFEDIIKSKKS